MSERISSEEKVRFVLLCMGSRRRVASLCQKYQISESCYYRWRKSFVVAGTDALRRQSNRVPKRIGSGKRSKIAPSVEAEHLRLLRCSITVRAEGVEGPRLADESKRALVRLIDSATVPKSVAAMVTGVPRRTYYRWRRELGSTRPPVEPKEAAERIRLTERQNVKQSLFKILHSPPVDHGFNRTTWRVDDLQKASLDTGLILGRHAIRAIIKGAGYRWLKARKVLTSRDPDYRAKLDRIQETLGGLAKDEGFFSIDEYGPFAVRMRGGRRLVAPGTIPTFPQWQKSKGALIITAALELSTNQVTHFYSEKKNTEEMIRLLEVLLARNRHLSRIYLSWDAASWHISKRLSERIASNNVMASVTGSTQVELAPLPAGAQFLNVIESIFSGMARAIIHNSDYQSEGDAKAAIDRYFAERNGYFYENPKRAGKLIWGKEHQLSSFSEANNSKDPAYR